MTLDRRSVSTALSMRSPGRCPRCGAGVLVDRFTGEVTDPTGRTMDALGQIVRAPHRCAGHVRTSDGGRVVLRLMRRAGGTQYYEVKVWGARKTHRGFVGVVEWGEVGAHGPKLLAALAGSLAEILAERHNDTIEPSAAARAVVEAYRELRREEKADVLIGDDEPAS